MKDKNLELMEKAPVSKAILTLALPTVFSSIATLLYNLADTYFVGLLDDMYQLGAVSLAYPVFIIMQAIGSIFGIGVGPYISRSLGAKKFDEVKKTTSVTFYTSVMATTLLSVIYFLFRTPILSVLGTSVHTFELTKQYLDIVVAFAFTMTMQTVLASFLRAEGKAKYAVAELVIGTVVNIILDPIFILVLDMGVVGAAIATILGIAAADIFCLAVLLKGKTNVSLRLSDFKPSLKIYREVFKIGVPACAGQLLMSVTNTAFNNIAAGYGDHVISAYGVASKMIFIAQIVLNSYTGGYMPFAGYNLGAGNGKRVRDGLRFTLLSSTAISLFLLIPFVGGAPAFMNAFTSDQTMLDLGVMILRTWAICLPFLGAQFTVLNSALKQAKKLRMIAENPADACYVKPASKTEMRYLAGDELRRFVRVIQGHPFERMFLVSLFTGMRESELLGLSWDEVDMNSNCITIRHQLQQIKGGYSMETPKSNKERKIYPPSFVMDILRTQQKEQRVQRLAAGKVWNNQHNLVFTKENGENISCNTLYMNFKRVITRNGFDTALRYHDLRHSYAVHATECGDDYKLIQQALGHYSSAFTADIYGHITDKARAASATRQNAAIEALYRDEKEAAPESIENG